MKLGNALDGVIIMDNIFERKLITTTRNETDKEFVKRLATIIINSKIGNYVNSSIKCNNNCGRCIFYSDKYKNCIINEFDDIANDIVNI